MKMVFLVLPLALLLAGVAVYAFVWATRSGQFDDLDTPARRMLHDDVPAGGDGDGDGDIGGEDGPDGGGGEGAGKADRR